MCSPMGNNRPAHWLKETMGSRILDSWVEWSIYNTACVLQGLMSNNVYCELSCDRLSELVFQISSLSFSKQYSFKAVFLLTLWSFESLRPLFPLVLHFCLNSLVQLNLHKASKCI